MLSGVYASLRTQNSRGRYAEFTPVTQDLRLLRRIYARLRNIYAEFTQHLRS
jgi:hypothetical protein